MTEQWERGEMGERVRDIVEQLLDGFITRELAERELRFLGLDAEQVQYALEETEDYVIRVDT